MTGREADDLLLVLRAAFATPHWDEATKDLYRGELQRLEAEDASTAVTQLVRTCAFRPPVAAILNEYRVARRQRMNGTPALPRPSLTEEERLENLRRIRELQETIGRSLDDVPVSTRIRPRPVTARWTTRLMGRTLDPPTEAERVDAIEILRDGPERLDEPWLDPLYLEAERIHQEASDE